MQVVKIVQSEQIAQHPASVQQGGAVAINLTQQTIIGWEDNNRLYKMFWAGWPKMGVYTHQIARAPQTMLWITFISPLKTVSLTQTVHQQHLGIILPPF